MVVRGHRGFLARPDLDHKTAVAQRQRPCAADRIRASTHRLADDHHARRGLQAREEHRCRGERIPTGHHEQMPRPTHDRVAKCGEHRWQRPDITTVVVTNVEGDLLVRDRER